MKTSTETRRRASEGWNPPGIVIRDGAKPAGRPVIRAFVWGGRVRALPTLPFGRWKSTSA